MAPLRTLRLCGESPSDQPCKTTLGQRASWP
jgi:hypothetical protein